MRFQKSLLALSVAVSLAGATATANAVTVAEVDTGVLPLSSLSNNIVSGGYNFINNNSDTTDVTSIHHGTVVAEVMVNTYPSVRILPLKVVGVNLENDTSVSASNSAVEYATANSDVRVINKGIGAFCSTSVLQAAAAANKVLVLGAGNKGGSSPIGDAVSVPALSGAGIVVGALGTDGNIAGYSNRAGSEANYYILAPGYNSFSSTQGSSFAAPHVSAAAAMIIAADPQLTAQQVVEILLSTATDMGAPGVDPIYGHGALNVQAALAPVGQTSVASGSSSSSGTALAAVALGAAVGYAILHNSKDLKKTLILDQFERGYVVDLTKITPVRDYSTDIKSILQSLQGQSHVVSFSDSPNNHFYAVVSNLESAAAKIQRLTSSPADDGTPDIQDVAMTLYGGDNRGMTYQFNLNTSPDRGFGALSFQSPNHTQLSFLSEQAFTAPYLGFTNQGVGARVGYNVDNDVNLKFGLVSSNDHQQFGLSSTGAVMEGSYKVNKRTTVSLQLGQLSEYGSFFGSASNSAFGVNKSTTFAVGLSGAYRLTSHVTLIGNYSEGYTRVNPNLSNSLLHHFTGIRSNTFGLGLVANSVVQRGDQFGFAVSQPLRVTSGSVTLDVPYARDIPGNIYKNSENVSLVPDATEHTMETYYRMPFGRHHNGEVTTYLMLQDHPLNNAQAPTNTTVFTAVQYSF